MAKVGQQTKRIIRLKGRLQIGIDNQDETGKLNVT